MTTVGSNLSLILSLEASTDWIKNLMYSKLCFSFCLEAGMFETNIKRKDSFNLRREHNNEKYLLEN